MFDSSSQKGNAVVRMGGRSCGTMDSEPPPAAAAVPMPLSASESVAMTNITAPGAVNTELPSSEYLDAEGMMRVPLHDVVLETFAMDPDIWSKYKDGVKSMYVIHNGCHALAFKTTGGSIYHPPFYMTDILGNIPWCHGIIFCPLVFGPCMAVACAQRYCCCQDFDSFLELPAHNEEALVLTSTGIKGYKPDYETCCCNKCATAVDYEPVALTWGNTRWSQIVPEYESGPELDLKTRLTLNP